MLTCGQGLHPAGQNPCVLASKLDSNWGPDCGQASPGPGCKWPTQTGWCRPRLCCSMGLGGLRPCRGGGQLQVTASFPPPDLSSLLPAPQGDRLQQQRCPPEPPAARTCPLRGAAAVVGVHAVHTGASVLAAVPRTVVNVFLTVLASEACSRGQPPGQASSRGQARTRPVTLALGSGTFLAGPRTPYSGRRAALHGLSCDAHRLGALGVPAPHPALPTPVTGPHTPEPTVSTFLSNRFVKGQLNRGDPQSQAPQGSVGEDVCAMASVTGHWLRAQPCARGCLHSPMCGRGYPI